MRTSGAGRVDSLKDKVATAFVIDATDGQALSVLPLNSVDVVIVAIGENFGAPSGGGAVETEKGETHLCKGYRQGAPFRCWRLSAWIVSLLLREDAARGLVHLFEFGADIETFRVDSNYYVCEFYCARKIYRLQCK